MLGSPSSRVNLTAKVSLLTLDIDPVLTLSKWASIGYARSITDPRTLSRVGVRAWLKDRVDVVVFRLTLGVIDLAFWWTLLKQREPNTSSFCGGIQIDVHRVHFSG